MEINIVSGNIIGREVPSSKANSRFVAIVESLICYPSLSITFASLVAIPCSTLMVHIKSALSIICGTEGMELVWVALP